MPPVRIGGQIPRRAEMFQKAEENLPVQISGRQNLDSRSRQPPADTSDRVEGPHGILEDLGCVAMRMNPRITAHGKATGRGSINVRSHHCRALLW